jgi:hypothetical protein
MLNNVAKIVFFVLIPLTVIGSPKEKGTAQVITVRTRIHGSSSGNMFTYTDQIFTEVNGKRLVYECAQRGDICPVLDAGKTYSGDLEGPYFYIPMTLPNGQKDVSVRFRQICTW